MAHMEFDAFRTAALEWLVAAPILDPPLAAAADVLKAVLNEREICELALDMNDTHGALGATAVLDLWRATSVSGG